MAAMTMTFEVPETKLIDKEIDETEFIMQNSEIMKAIKNGDAQIKSGNFETSKLEDLWK